MLSVFRKQFEHIEEREHEDVINLDSGNLLSTVIICKHLVTIKGSQNQWIALLYFHFATHKNSLVTMLVWVEHIFTGLAVSLPNL